MKKLNIGLFGFGVVGEGIYQVLEDLPQFQSTVCKLPSNRQIRNETLLINCSQPMQMTSSTTLVSTWSLS